jgi:hypothetical protein
MNTNHKTHRPKSIFRKLACLVDETVLHVALVGVVLAAVVDGFLSIGGGTIA